MKKQIFTVMFFMAGLGMANQLNAQEKSVNEKSKASWDLKTNTTCRVTTTATGCDVTFSYEVKSPKDVATGQATGKRMHKPYSFAVSSTDNSVTEITSPKDQSTGQSTGKVSYSDLSVMISPEKASVGKKSSQKIVVEDGQFTLPEEFQDGNCDVTLSWSWGASNRCTKTFTVSMQEGQMMAINVKGTSSQKK